LVAALLGEERSMEVEQRLRRPHPLRAPV